MKKTNKNTLQLKKQQIAAISPKDLAVVAGGTGTIERRSMQ